MCFWRLQMLEISGQNKTGVKENCILLLAQPLFLFYTQLFTDDLNEKVKIKIDCWRLLTTTTQRRWPTNKFMLPNWRSMKSKNNANTIVVIRGRETDKLTPKCGNINLWYLCSKYCLYKQYIWEINPNFKVGTVSKKKRRNYSKSEEEDCSCKLCAAFF